MGGRGEMETPGMFLARRDGCLSPWWLVNSQGIGEKEGTPRWEMILIVLMGGGGEVQKAHQKRETGMYEWGKETQ